MHVHMQVIKLQAEWRLMSVDRTYRVRRPTSDFCHRHTRHDRPRMSSFAV